MCFDFVADVDVDDIAIAQAEELVDRALNINRSNKKLAAVYFYYANIVSWKSLEATLGKNHKKLKMPNGRTAYLYQFQNRELMVIVDSANNVFNVGIW